MKKMMQRLWLPVLLLLALCMSVMPAAMADSSYVEEVRGMMKEGDVVLIDSDGVLVYLTGDWYIENGYLCHDAMIANDTDFGGYMYEDDSLINGWLAEGGYSYSCPAYGKHRATIKLRLKEAGVTSLEEINTVQLNVRVEKREASRTFLINPDAVDKQVSTPSADDLVLIDESGVLVYLTGDWYVDGSYVCHDATIVNSTAFNGYMYEDDSLVNGWLAEGGYSYSCPAYGKHRATIKLRLKEAGVTTLEEIETIQLNVRVEKRTASHLFNVQPAEEEAQPEENANDEVILIDDTGVLVYLTGDWYIDGKYVCHDVMIVNDTDFSGYMYEDDSLVNGWLAEGGYSYSCPAYGKHRATVKLRLTEAGVASLKEINTIQLNVRVEKREASQSFVINPDAVDKQVSTPSANDFVIIEQSGVLVYLTGEWYVDGNYVCHDATIVNDTAFNGYMYEDDSLVNGWLAEGGYSYSCPAYGKHRATIKLRLKESGVTTLEEIETIQLNVRVEKREGSHLFYLHPTEEKLQIH